MPAESVAKPTIESVEFGAPVEVTQQDPTSPSSGGEVRLTVSPPGPGDPAALYDPPDSSEHLVIVNVSADALSGTPYLRSPGFKAWTEQGERIAPAMLAGSDSFESGIMESGERRSGVIGFLLNSQQTVTRLTWNADDGYVRAEWK